MYNTTLRIQKRKKRRLLLVGIFLGLLAAAGGILYRLPISLQDISRIIQLAAGKFSHSPADIVSAGTVLRGTIYDRNFKELAVSYELFSLFVHPAKIYDHGLVANQLATIAGVETSQILQQLKVSKRVVELADDLDADQVGAINALQIEGVYCTGSPKRFYPENTAAAHVLGYTSDSLGLAGIERKYDLLLQPGAYQPADVAGIDFIGSSILGEQGTDLVLTLDVELQKKVDHQLQHLLDAQGTAFGMALLMNPVSGHVLALSSQPSFNPNYFWQAKESNRWNRLYKPVLDLDLVRPLLIGAAAMVHEGKINNPLLPRTIAAPDFGIDAKEYEQFVGKSRFLQPVEEVLPSEVGGKAAVVYPAAIQGVSIMQMGAGLASLFNGGWRLEPGFLDSIIDLKSDQRFLPQEQLSDRTRILDPAMGVLVRRVLSAQFFSAKKRLGLHLMNKSTRVVSDGALSRYMQQQVFIGMAPDDKPTMLLLVVVERENLAPLAKKEKDGLLASVGKDLLTDCYAHDDGETVAVHPQKKNQDNFARFLISRRLEYRTLPVDNMDSLNEMPQVTGLSLRKGLQRLNNHNLKITIKGSGRIVAQVPKPGERMEEMQTCQLTLESEI